jgi:hypothetical protein
VRSSPRSGTDGGGPIRSASTAGLGRCGRAGRSAPFRPAEKRGRGALRLRFMTEQPPYSLLVRGIDADVLPVAEQFGMGVLPWLLARRSRSRLGDFMDNGDYPSNVRNPLSDSAIPATWARR